MNDFSELKRLAEAAPAKGKNCWYTHGDFESVFDSDDSKYMAEAEPSLILALIAEVEALRKDADRYRWLRDDSIDPGTVIDKKVGVFNSEDGGYPIWEYRTGDELDSAIDAAMTKGDRP